MSYLQHDSDHLYTLHNQATDPGLVAVTAPLRMNTFPVQESWYRRMFRTIGRFFAFIIHKINQLLGLALVLLLLLLTARFLLTCFALKASLFASWVYLVSSYPLFPFDNLAPAIVYNGYVIDISTLIAMFCYGVAVSLVRRFLKLLITR